MSRDKQIDEMAKDLCHMLNCDLKKIGKNCYKGCKAHIYAERAVNEGYAKASEVIEEIITYLSELEKLEYLYAGQREALGVRYAIKMLKKKYTEN